MKHLWKWRYIVLFLAFWMLPWHLWGQGIAHFNTIHWTVSTTPGVTSQKIWRATAALGPYTVIGTIPNGTTNSFVDNNVTQGVTHFYVLTALVGTNESPFATSTSAIDVGTNVNPQTGLGVDSQ